MEFRGFCGLSIVMIVTLVAGVTSLSFKHRDVLNDVYETIEISNPCQTTPCHNFDVIGCDQRCTERYRGEYDILFEGCLEICADDYIYCKFTLECDIS